MVLQYLNKDLLRAERFINNQLESRELIEEQRNKLKEFDEHLRSEGKLIYTRRQYLVCLKAFGKFLKKPFNDAVRKDFEDFFISINDRKETTIFGWKVGIRLFYKWLFNIRGKGKYPEIVEYEIKKPSKVMIPKFLSEEQVKEMISITDCIRDKCLLSVMFESGCRIGEILSLNIEDISFDKEYPVARFTVKLQEGCKRGSRPISLVNTVPILKEYINTHPLRNQENSPLFVSVKAPIERLCTRGASEIVEKYSKRLKLEGIGCHTFRHSRFRDLREKGFSILDMKQLGGWTRFDMVERYCRVADIKNIENKMLEMNGIKMSKEEKKAELLKPKICFCCGTANDTSNVVCSNCSVKLDQKEVIAEQTKQLETLRNLMKVLPKLEKLIEYAEKTPMT